MKKKICKCNSLRFPCRQTLIFQCLRSVSVHTPSHPSCREADRHYRLRFISKLMLTVDIRKTQLIWVMMVPHQVIGLAVQLWQFVTMESWRRHQEVAEGEVVAKEGNIFTPKLDTYMNVESLVIGMNGWNMNVFVLGHFKNPCVQVTPSVDVIVLLHYTFSMAVPVFSFSFSSFDLLTNIENMTSLLFLMIALWWSEQNQGTFMTRGWLCKGLQKCIWELGRSSLCWADALKASFFAHVHTLGWRVYDTRVHCVWHYWTLQHSEAWWAVWPGDSIK